MNEIGPFDIFRVGVKRYWNEFKHQFISYTEWKSGKILSNWEIFFSSLLVIGLLCSIVIFAVAVVTDGYHPPPPKWSCYGSKLDPITKTCSTCNCNVGYFAKMHVGTAKLIFEGEVLHAKDVRDWKGPVGGLFSEYGDNRAATFKVLKSWKGDLKSKVIVHTSLGGCGIFFEKGEKYLIYAETWSPDNHWTYHCNGSKPLALASASGEIDSLRNLKRRSVPYL